MKKAIARAGHNKLIWRLELLPELLLLSDSALPTGGFSHSYGLETFVARGEKDLTALLEAYIQMEHGKVECPSFVLAYHAAADRNLKQLLEIDQTVETMKIPREWREAGRQTGRRLLVISQTFALYHNRIENAGIWREYNSLVKAAEAPGQYPVVAGLIYQLMGFPVEVAVLSFAAVSLKNIVNAAVRMVPLGQTDGLKLQCSFHRKLEKMAAEALEITGLDELGGFAPEYELAGMEHEHLYTRLFIS
jgi:Urease accessory protein UreF